MRLVTLEQWVLQPDRCPADLDFLDLAEKERWTGLSIFQVGPGMHHSVGKVLGQHNTVLSVTCSPAEMDAYMTLAIEDPILARNVQCIFADVYNLHDSHLRADFDVVYLPHLCEQPREERALYNAMSPAGLLEMMFHHLGPHGKRLFVGYKGSAAWREALSEFEKFPSNLTYDFKSLRIWAIFR